MIRIIAQIDLYITNIALIYVLHSNVLHKNLCLWCLNLNFLKIHLKSIFILILFQFFLNLNSFNKKKISNLIFYLNRTLLYVKFMAALSGSNILVIQNKYDVYNNFLNFKKLKCILQKHVTLSIWQSLFLLLTFCPMIGVFICMTDP